MAVIRADLARWFGVVRYNARMRRVLLVCVLALSACPSPPETDAGLDAGPACPEFVLRPPTVDFGCGARGETFTVPFPDAGATPGLFSSVAFTLDDAGLLHFTPPEAREYEANIPLYHGPCLLGAQRVIGTGVASVLSWSPAMVDFGYVRPGLTRRELVTFSSCSALPLALRDAAVREGTMPSTVFALDAGSLVVPGATRTDAGVLVNGTLALELSFSPTALGPRQGQLTLTAPLASQPAVSATLRGVGGGPQVDVSPSALDAGTITTVTVFQVIIKNVGTPAAPVDPRANLFLGLDGGQPYFELTPATCGAVTMSSYNPLVGLAAGPDSVTLSVELQPPPAPRTCTLRVFSTDPVTPELTVSIAVQ